MDETRFIIALIGSINEMTKQFLNDELRKNNIEGLVSTHGSILSLLFRNNGRMQIKDITEASCRKKSTVTDALKKLVESGYVERLSCPRDARVSYISLTEKGLAMREKFFAISANLIDRCYKGFTDEEKEKLVVLLKKLQKNFL